MGYGETIGSLFGALVTVNILEDIFEKTEDLSDLKELKGDID